MKQKFHAYGILFSLAWNKKSVGKNPDVSRLIRKHLLYEFGYRLRADLYFSAVQEESE